MDREPQRTIKEVLIKGERGNLLHVDDLHAMPPDKWRLLRTSISNQHQGGDGITMVCKKCGHPVYIRVYSYFNCAPLPGFAHYDGSPVNCPWYQGKNRTLDSLKAEQYNGQQESPEHILLCNKIGELAGLDKRCIRNDVNKYHKPTNNPHGRTPDVFIEWKEGGKFAIELQLSNTFEAEISGRCIYYSKEKIPLIWVLHDVHEYKTIPQSIKDVIIRHRNNAFVIDRDSIKESYKQNTLVLKCYMVTGDSFESPELVNLDALTIPGGEMLPFYRDHISPTLRRKAYDRRKPFFDFFCNWEKRDARREDIKFILKLLPEEVPEEFIFMIAAAFSIVATVAERKDVNYASNDPNVRAMLNSYFNGYRLARYADMIEFILGRINHAVPSVPNVTTEAINRNIKKRKVDTKQVGIEDPEWRIMKWLIPELFNEIDRELLRYIDQLPSWVKVL
ncbi:MAG: hypothetical protein RBR18_10320 [Desulfovibrionaceae bacterium]|nr:hypothetical protein [Desulfovibrionaceae bacterium]